MNVLEINEKLKSYFCDYNGQTDKYGFRSGQGHEIWKNSSYQDYKGSFFQDCLHGYGAYKWIINDQGFSYDGQFYCNSLDGYGQLSYLDCAYEGLFKDNQRFGPGVSTYNDGKQDVGLWLGLNLVRLCCEVNQIPSLANSSIARTYLLRFKKIISMLNDNQQITENIISNLTENKFAINHAHELYSYFIKNPKSYFFNKKLHDISYSAGAKDFSLNVIVDFYDDVPVLNVIIATEFLAWNNEELIIDIMKHAYLNKNFENTLTYNILDVLAAHRHKFRECGPVENVCKRFLEACFEGNQSLVIQMICENDLYVNVTDARGNCGMLYASAQEHVSLLRTLTNYGSNPNQLNDECITPLSFSVLNYIAVINIVVDWEIAFLPPFVDKIVHNEVWKLNIDENFKDILFSKVTSVQAKDYIFNLDSCPGKTMSSQNEKKIRIEEQLIDTTKLERIQDTIFTLLELGADINKTEVPLPLMFLSIFTHNCNIVTELIKYGANIFIKTNEEIGSLSLLHVVATLLLDNELVLIAKILIEHGADVNTTTNSLHWIKEKEFILAGTHCEDCGKTPLHLLAMRCDYTNQTDCLLQLAKLFIEHADMNKLYLGHTPLSLAILRGNLKLIRQILECGIDPNQSLGNNMGIPLTVLCLKRYNNVLSLNLFHEVNKILIKFNANPLHIIPEFQGNVIDFLSEENPLGATKKNTMKCFAKTFLLYHIGGKILHSFIHDCNLNFNATIKFLNIEDTLKILKTLLQHNIVKFNMDYFTKLFYVLLKTNKIDKPEKRVKYLIDSLESDKMEDIFAKYPPPEIDKDEDRYKVCFECLLKKNKTLILCPQCELIYFCSEKCNVDDIKSKVSRHPCKLKYYEQGMLIDGIRNKFYVKINEQREIFKDGTKSKFDKENGENHFSKQNPFNIKTTQKKIKLEPDTGTKEKKKGKYSRSDTKIEDENKEFNQSKKHKFNAKIKGKRKEKGFENETGSNTDIQINRNKKRIIDDNETKDNGGKLKKGKKKSKFNEHKESKKKVKGSSQEISTNADKIHSNKKTKKSQHSKAIEYDSKRHKPNPILKKRSKSTKHFPGNDRLNIARGDKSGRGRTKSRSLNRSDKRIRMSRKDQFYSTKCTSQTKSLVQRYLKDLGLGIDQYEELLKIFNGVEPSIFHDIFMYFCFYKDGEFYYKFANYDMVVKLSYSDV